MKKNRGITLIALIITIILLLILVGVSVNVIIKGNLFSNAQKAVDGTNAKVNEQQTIMDELMNEWDEIEKDYCSHIWKDGEMLLQPTCTTTGKKQKVCENCGKLLEVEIPALGHNYVNRVCTRCGEKEPGCTTHTYGDWVITKSPTCVAEGSKKRTCTVCGVEEVETIPATGVHTYGEWQVTKQATCTADGIKTKTCTGCGATQSQSIAKLGHNYVNGTCTRCGEKQELVIGANINYHEYISESGGTVSASYTSTKTTRGSTDSSDSNATYSVVNNSGIQWIVLGEENGQIKITTKNIVQPTSGGYTSGNFKYLRIQGQNGYTNCIDELNKISAVYGKGKYADTTKFSTSGGRSFKMEDLGYGALTRTASYKYARHSDGKVYRYAANATVDGTSTTGGSYTTFNYMALDASNSTDETSSSHTWKSLSTTANSYVTMYQYTYSGRRTLSTEVSKADTYYWLASRALYCDYGDVRYNARLVYTDGYDSYSNFYASDGSNYYPSDYGVRPVVYLKSDIQLSYDSSSGYTISE
mgnify:FL=1